MSDENIRRYRLPYHGPYNDMRAVLETGPQHAAMFGDKLPFCVQVLIGRLIENACLGFGMERADCKASIPVTAVGKIEHINIDISFDVTLQDTGAYDECYDGKDISEYKDGTVILREWDGPIRYRQEHWNAAEVQLLSHDVATAKSMGRITREPKGAKGAADGDI